MGDAIPELVDMWDKRIRDWCDHGASTTDGDLRPLFDAYTGSGVVPEALPEPWFGNLHSAPAVVFLALNPGVPFLGTETWRNGEVMPDLQSPDGVFAREIRKAGSYSRWAEKFPDWRRWASSPNTFFTSRERFARDWIDDPRLTLNDCVGFELYPWHSARFSAASLRLRGASLALLDRWVIEPIAALGCPFVFGFGKAWFNVLPSLGFRPAFELSTRAGDTWPNAPKDRLITVFEKGGLRIVAEYHSGGAGPPKQIEVPVLRELLLPHVTEDP